MARIRSIHPTIFTGDAFMTATVENPLSLIFLQGLWCQADDKGAFEWKPVSLKARIVPATSAAGSDLLEYLVRLDLIACYSVQGVRFGVIRKFAEFQRPKTPNDVYPMPRKWRIYSGLPLQEGVSYPLEDGEIAEIKTTKTHDFPQKGEMSTAEQDPFLQNGEIDAAEEPSFPQNGEIVNQMEDGGDNRRMEKEERIVGTVSKIELPTPPVSAKALPQPRGSRLQNDWQPTESDLAYAESLSLDPGPVADEFRFYWTSVAGKAGLKLNWSQAFKGHCLRQSEHRKNRALSRSSPANQPFRNGFAQVLHDKYNKPQTQDIFATKLLSRNEDEK